jgi:dihydroflavonol-4-reductase
LRAAYFDTKHAAEVCVLEQAGADLDAVAVNPGAIYGPSAAPSNSGHVVASAVRGRLRFVPKGGVNAASLATVVDCTLAASRNGRCGERYVVPGDNLTILHLVRRIGAAAGVELDPLMLPGFLGPAIRFGMELVEPFVPDRNWFTPDLCGCFNRFMWVSGDKARRELGVEPRSLDEALRGQVEQMRREGRL